MRDEEALVLRPQGWHDLRQKVTTELRYPRASLVLVAGLPGAGKSTLLRRLFQLSGQESHPAIVNGVHVVDSLQTRLWWGSRLPQLPRSLVRGSHFVRVYRRVRRGISTVAHTRGTRRFPMRLLADATRKSGSGLHVVLIDVSEQVAVQGQHVRGRIIPTRTFNSHSRSWKSIIAAGPHNLTEQFAGARSAVLLDRAAVDGLQAIRLVDEEQ